MKQLLSKKGQVIIQETPAPLVSEHDILVRVEYSCISSGTELNAIKRAGEPLYKKALRQPQSIQLALEMIKKQGLASLVERVKSIENTGQPLGYSAAGVVLEVGKSITDIAPGDKVACAGAGIANHAEFISVPRNLTVKIPHDLSTKIAATVTMGSIAVQGVRRADIHFGEYVAVIGLGILGQLSAQLLKMNGCYTLGIDHDQRRLDKAVVLGLNKGINPLHNNVIEESKHFTNGHGFDAVIITASSAENNVINDAMKICRKKGKVVIVGDVGLNLQREEFYKKELDVLISTSYGPGRYDENYELKGQDYPYGYVRWTENRNMDAYIRSLAERRILVDDLIERTCRLDDAPDAYQKLNGSAEKPIITLIEYSKEAERSTKVLTASPRAKSDKVKVGLIGCGNFVQSTVIPALKQLKNDYEISAISGKTGSNATSLAQQCQAHYATTDYHKILNDPSIDAVVIATRHNLHASIAAEAASAGKAIFLEKPMALNPQELNLLVQAIEKNRIPFMVGFNRRFSPSIQKTKNILKGHQSPIMVNYRMNAGFIPQDHWIQGKEGGGRNIGEACHIYDLFTFLTESEVKGIHATAINNPSSQHYGRNDNFAATISYENGSVCNLLYTALGSTQAPKEQMEIYFDGKIIQLNDYKQLSFIGINSPELNTALPEKGHLQELEHFVRSIKKGDGYPIPLWQLIQATEISFKVEELICQPQ